MDRLVEKLRVEGEGVRFTSQDCTRYGGYPVALIHLDELPYWAELVDNRLGFAQEMERQRELARVLKAFYSSLPPLGEYTWTAQEQEIEEVAKEYVKETGSQIRWFLPAGETVLGQSGLKFLFVHSLSSLKEGRVCPDVPLSCLGFSEEEYRHRHIVLPATCGERDFNPETSPFNIKNEATILLQERGLNRQILSLLCDMSDKYINKLPADGVFYAFSALHEMRHSRQGRWECPIMRTYAEVDADMFATHVLEKAGMGAVIKETNLCDRYLELLTSDGTTHWIAPTMDCLYQGCVPPDYGKVVASVQEIRFRLGADLLGHRKARTLSSESVQRSFALQAETSSFSGESVKGIEKGYLDWLNEHSWTKFGVVLSLLRKQLKKGIYTDGIARGIAQGIVKSAEYFNPDLTRKLFLGLPSERKEKVEKGKKEVEQHIHAYIIHKIRREDTFQPSEGGETVPPRPPARDVRTYHRNVRVEKPANT